MGISAYPCISLTLAYTMIGPDNNDTECLDQYHELTVHLKHAQTKIYIYKYLLFCGLLGRTFTALLLFIDALLKKCLWFVNAVLSVGSAPLLHPSSSETQTLFSIPTTTMRSDINLSNNLSIFIQSHLTVQ